MHDFLVEVEATVLEYAKAALIDPELLKYSQALIVAGIFSAALEISLNFIRDFYIQAGAGMLDSTRIPIIDTESLRLCSNVWEQIMEGIFGDESLKHIDQFGRYIVLRL